MFHGKLITSVLLVFSMLLSMLPAAINNAAETDCANTVLEETHGVISDAPKARLVDNAVRRGRAASVYSIGADTVAVARSTDPYLSAFDDIDDTQWYAAGIRYVLEHGIMNGMGDGKFNPNGKTTRAQLATILWNIEGRPVVSYTLDFKDVKSSDWFVGAIRWAVSKKLMGGVDNKIFDPDGELTREQLVTILYRYAVLKGKGFGGVISFKLNYPDADQVEEWAVEPFCWMTFNGIMNGKDGKLAPKEGATRAEIATVLMRFNEIISK
ncbi:MAG: S-layer homology domain-containing protein [Oscillospiraceae bacterium]|nr:S-layer homology domain-containing protein [Oscillospiraceae bacterium]